MCTLQNTAGFNGLQDKSLINAEDSADRPDPLGFLAYHC
eukprot:COSAG02_NODE_29014_length_577_cov_1.288703_1_plen_38_part_10